ncbi:MAG: Flagellar biosynthesis protein FlhF [uncultured Sulfurovum sp.]|uniref:Flagellar biosynthesis protein FlhF n=1 Tax=uncultured Sulfurovum sp. TaxID=269237 RepID=A0A6S6SG16_9BACT|nr:MAG: Flagellar biosynthesis protein FlhF [uncultured Sulfurovum sp.]
MLENEDEKLLTVNDVRALRKEITLMHGALAKDVLEHTPLIKKVVDRFSDYGLDRIWTEKLLAPLAGTTLEEDEEILIAYVLEELDSLLKVEEEAKNLTKTVRVIVGATGIGKTSLIGKIAARYRYFLSKSHKVGFVNFDQHKVGSEEQLENYAEAMAITLVPIEAFFEEEYDLLLVDTAGGLGNNLKNLHDLIDLIDRNSDYAIEISLVLSATSKIKDLAYVNNAFAGLNITNFILTKLDETSDVSELVNFLIQEKKSVSYISTGQQIPEDLVVATKEYILNEFMKKNV